MSGSQAGSQPNVDRYVVIHVATTCDEHGVYVTKDSAEVIELGWILLDAKSLDEVGCPFIYLVCSLFSWAVVLTSFLPRSSAKASLSNLSTPQSLRSAVSRTREYPCQAGGVVLDGPWTAAAI